MAEYEQDQTAFRFRGDWGEYLPIALTNALLTLVTLGFYRFWGIARERKYLWSKTQFLDDRLEWTGTGLELFFGALMAFVLIGVPLFAIQFGIQALLLQGQTFVAGALSFLLYVMLFALAGYGIFAGLRYRLSRTYWHGIRGGTSDRGLGFALSYLWKMMLGFLTLGLMVPWASANLWKERWEKMSFGPHYFQSNPRWQVLMKRYILFYVGPLLLVGIAIYGAMRAGAGAGAPVEAMAGAAGLGLLLFYVVLPAVALAYYALYAREMVSSLKLDTLSFRFTARSLDWLLLFLGNAGIMFLAFIVGLIALSVFGGGMAALGVFANPEAMAEGAVAPATAIGSVVLLFLCFVIPMMLVGPFVRFRNWAFYIRHAEADGHIDLARLSQSSTRDLRQGEGILDAFDMGAI